MKNDQGQPKEQKIDYGKGIRNQLHHDKNKKPPQWSGFLAFLIFDQWTNSARYRPPLGFRPAAARILSCGNHFGTRYATLIAHQRDIYYLSTKPINSVISLMKSSLFAYTISFKSLFKLSGFLN